MGAWTEAELADLGRANELLIAPERRDGTLQRSRIVWVVRHGQDVFVRSVNGPGGGWFRGLQARRAGHVSVGAIDVDVLFEDADHGLDDEIDEEYRRKYGRSSTAVDRITSPDARSTTVRFART